MTTEPTETPGNVRDHTSGERVDSRPRRGDASVLDRGLYALFSRHADRQRHAGDRANYRGTTVEASFATFLARVYGLSWAVAIPTCLLVAGLTLALSSATVTGVARFLTAGVPFLATVPIPMVPRPLLAVGAGLVTAALAKRGVIHAGGRYLAWAVRVRRADIERTLPGAVRYLRALSTGSDDQRTMLRKVAANEDAYGETAVALRKVLNRGTLTGDLGRGMDAVARDTPSTDMLGPFLLKFREHANQGGDALTNYLRMEGRMLSHRQSRARTEAAGFLELVAELFVVLLVLPALFVIVVTVLSVLTPGLNDTVATPGGAVPVRTVLVAVSCAFIVVVGLCAAWLLAELRPPAQSTPTYERPATLLATVRSAATNPASAAVCALPPTAGVAAALWVLGYDLLNVALLGYAAYALPVGVVALRRARRDDAKDREIKDFVHAVSGQVSLGRPFTDAVEVIARDIDLGALDEDVADLAFNSQLATHDGDLRGAALERFVDRVGTPLAEQTVGLVTGALDVGSDPEDVFDTLQEEVARLHHEKKELRSQLLVYVAVGWTTALLLIGIAVAVNLYVLDSFAQLSSVPTGSAGFVVQPNAVDLARERYRFYAVTQATMLACGWFAGTASRDRYEALFHSGALVLVAYVVFAGGGLL